MVFIDRLNSVYLAGCAECCTFAASHQIYVKTHQSAQDKGFTLGRVCTLMRSL